MIEQEVMLKLNKRTPACDIANIESFPRCFGYVAEFTFMQSITTINIIICGKNNPACWSETALSQPYTQMTLMNGPADWEMRQKEKH